MVVTIVGAFDPEKTRKMVTDVLGAFPAGKLDVPAPPVEQPIDGVREKTVKIPRAKAHLALGFHGSTLKDEDKFPLEVLSNILAGQGGRLFQELRDKQSLAYTVTADVRPRLDPGIFLFYIACDESKADRALPGLLSEVEKIRNAPVDKEELDRSVNNLIGNHVINLQSSWARAENTGLNTLYGLGPLYDEVYLKKIAAVTVEDVQRVARKYLDPKKVGIVKILPEEENEKKEKK
jgi:zinc protease